MAVSAKNTSIKLGGTPVVITAEATTDAGDHLVYQVTDATRRVLDPATAVVVKADGVTVSSGYTVDYLFGRVTFDDARGAAEAITVDGAYVPLLTVATARASELNGSADLLDTSIHSPSLWRTYGYGLRSMDGSLELVEDLLTDHDPGAGEKVLATLINANTKVLLELQVGGTGDKLRAWALLQGRVGGPLGDLVTGSVTWKAAGSGNAAPFGFGS